MTEKVVFIKGAPSLEYGEIAELIDIAKEVDPSQEHKDMKIGLMTPAMERNQ